MKKAQMNISHFRFSILFNLKIFSKIVTTFAQWHTFNLTLPRKLYAVAAAAISSMNMNAIIPAN